MGAKVRSKAEAEAPCSVSGCKWKAYPDTGKCWRHSLEHAGKASLSQIVGPPIPDDGHTFQTVLERTLADVSRFALAEVEVERLREAVKDALAVMELRIASECDWCEGQGGWTDDKEPRPTPVQHREGCEYVALRAALAEADK